MTTSTPATVAPEATPAKAPSKMELCGKLYEEVFTPGYDLGGKSQRSVFITRAQAEHGMTKNGANTYYQNLSNAARGKGKYKYNKYVSKAGSKADVAEKGKTADAGLDLPGAGKPSKGAVAAAEKAATKTATDLTQRWQVLDGTEVVNSFPTRSAAKKAAVNGLTWADSQAS